MAVTSTPTRGSGRGHTLVELATVLAIAALALALAGPALAGLLRGQELEAAAVGVARTLRLAHWRAIVTGSRAKVTADASGGRWRFCVQREQGSAWVADGEQVALPPGAVVAIAGPEEKVFNPDGTCSLGSITVSDGSGAVYKCTLAPATGRVRFYRGEREAGRGR